MLMPTYAWAYMYKGIGRLAMPRKLYSEGPRFLFLSLLVASLDNNKIT